VNLLVIGVRISERRFLRGVFLSRRHQIKNSNHYEDKEDPKEIRLLVVEFICARDTPPRTSITTTVYERKRLLLEYLPYSDTLGHTVSSLGAKSSRAIALPG
jgi:hypothetical protein